MHDREVTLDNIFFVRQLYDRVDFHGNPLTIRSTSVDQFTQLRDLFALFFSFSYKLVDLLDSVFLLFYLFGSSTRLFQSRRILIDRIGQLLPKLQGGLVMLDLLFRCFDVKLTLREFLLQLIACSQQTISLV